MPDPCLRKTHTNMYVLGNERKPKSSIIIINAVMIIASPFGTPSSAVGRASPARADLAGPS